MKRIYLFLTASLLAAFAVPAMAQTQTEDDIINKGLIPYEELNLSEYMTNANIGYQALEMQYVVQSNGGEVDVLGSNKICGDIVIPEDYTYNSLLGGQRTQKITTLYKRALTGGGGGAFQYSYITSCKISKNITEIQQATFADCPYLTDIIVDDANTKFFDDNGVLYMKNGTAPETYTLVAVPGNRDKITILEGTTAIADCAFDGCFRITNVTIPATVTSIGVYAFTGSGVKTITCLHPATPEDPTPPEVNGTEGSNHGFYDMLNEGSITVYVPAGSGETYRNNEDWNQFKIVELSVPSTGDNTFALNVTFVATKENNLVTAIKEIHVEGANGEEFKELPKNWTLTYKETVYKIYDGVMSVNFHDDDKTTVCITFIDNDNDGVDEPGLDIGDGTYVLDIPAETLESTEGKKNVATTREWTIEAPEPVYVDALHSVVLTIEDSDDNYTWRYKDAEGNTIYESSEGHTVGNVFKEETTSVTDASNNTTITNHIYMSDQVQYLRTFKNDKWQPLYVPFAMDYSAWSDQFEVAEITGIIENGFESEIEFYVIGDILGEDDTVEPHTPYLIRAKNPNADIAKKLTVLKDEKLSADDGEYTKISIPSTKNSGYTYNFVGQYTAARGTDGTNDKIPYSYGNDGYNFVMKGGVLKHPSQENGAKLGAFRWYISITKENPNAESATFSFGRFDNDGTTGIEEVTTENVTVKGIYDLQGRKIDEITKPGLYIVDGVKVLVK